MSEHENDGFYWEPTPKTTCARATCCSTSQSRSCRSSRDSCSARRRGDDPDVRGLPGQPAVGSDRGRGQVRGLEHGRHTNVPRLRRREGRGHRRGRAGRGAESRHPRHHHGAEHPGGQQRAAAHVPVAAHRPRRWRSPRLQRSRTAGSARVDAQGQPSRLRRLGLYVESRIALRKAMARFWARGNADESIERAMRPQLEKRPLEDLE